MNTEHINSWFVLDQNRLEEEAARIKAHAEKYPRPLPLMSVREFNSFHQTRTCAYCNTPGDLHSSSCRQCGAPFNSRTISPL